MNCELQNRETILLIDDNPLITKLNRETLQLHGYNVIEGASISQGRELYEQFEPDVIMMETVLPDGNGLHFCRELRSRSTIPIMIVSKLNSNEDICAGHNAGADVYMPKPYMPDMLVVRMEVLLRRIRWYSESPGLLSGGKQYESQI